MKRSPIRTIWLVIVLANLFISMACQLTSVFSDSTAPSPLLVKPSENQQATLKLNVKAGERFTYRSTFTQLTGEGKSTRETTYTIVIQKVAGGKIYFEYEDDPDEFTIILDEYANFLDAERDGKSAREQLSDGYDQTNAVVFGNKPVGVGDSWEIEVGYPRTRVRYEVKSFGSTRGMNVVEIQSSPKGYDGPIKFLVNLANGMLFRAEYAILNPGIGSRIQTVTELVP